MRHSQGHLKVLGTLRHVLDFTFSSSTAYQAFTGAGQKRGRPHPTPRCHCSQHEIFKQLAIPTFPIRFLRMKIVTKNDGKVPDVSVDALKHLEGSWSVRTSQVAAPRTVCMRGVARSVRFLPQQSIRLSRMRAHVPVGEQVEAEAAAAKLMHELRVGELTSLGAVRSDPSARIAAVPAFGSTRLEEPHASRLPQHHPHVPSHLVWSFARPVDKFSNWFIAYRTHRQSSSLFASSHCALVDSHPWQVLPSLIIASSVRSLWPSSIHCHLRHLSGHQHASGIMLDERELAIHPIVTESVQHNARVSPRPDPPSFPS